MSDISVLGLGLMGAALARALQRSGRQICVWNRSPEKMKLFIESGATGASSAASAVETSPVVLICIDNHTVTRSLLQTDEVVTHLAGRTLIQLSTVSPLEAQEAESLLNDCGASYIDGAILGGPDSVDGGDAQILFAGLESAYREVEWLLSCLTNNPRYVGENIRAAATLDLAWLCQRFGLFLGLAHGARLCESEDVGAGLYATMFPDGDRANAFARVIDEDAYEDTGATLSVWEASLRGVQKQARDAGINNEFPEFASGIFKRAISDGYGNEDVAALIKVLRNA